MSFINLFNPSFLMFLGILVLVSVLLVVYIESKIREQNHKMSAMVGLISSLATEINSIKLNVQNGGNNSHPAFSNLIEVSDDENSDDSDENDINDIDKYSINEDSINEDSNDEDSNDEDSNDEDSNVEDSNDEHGNDKEINDDRQNNNEIKILKLSNLFNNLDQTNAFELDELNENNLELNEDELDNLDDLDDSIDVSVLDEFNEENNMNIQDNDLIQIIEKPNEDIQPIINTEKSEKNLQNSFDLDLKTININLAEETKNIGELKNIEETDYKKMTIHKLRIIVVEKGLSNDASKLKKPEILKMLGIE